jgi:hypothetical protein
MNGDGKPDLLLVNSDNTVGVLLGNGDGTFQTAVSYSSAGTMAFSLAVADVNRDGKPDIVVANECAEDTCENGSVSVLVNTTPWPYEAIVKPPINADGSSVFRPNRTALPVKFTLTQNGKRICSLPAATISVTRTAGGVIGPIDESVYSLPGDNGSNFRIDHCQYIYNLAASSLGVGTYRVDISIHGSIVGHAIFGLK